MALLLFCGDSALRQIVEKMDEGIIQIGWKFDARIFLFEQVDKSLAFLGAQVLVGIFEGFCRFEGFVKRF